MTNYLTLGTDRSGVTTGDTQTIAPSNIVRRTFRLQNTSDADIRISDVDEPATDSFGFVVKPGDYFDGTTSGAVTLWCGEAGHSFQATER